MDILLHAYSNLVSTFKNNLNNLVCTIVDYSEENTKYSAIAVFWTETQPNAVASQSKKA